jgi:hypothetical protein
MPPRRSARVAAAEERALSALAPLPHALVQAIFLLLPVDARARAAAVCRGWRAVLADPSFWLRLDLSDARVTCPKTDAALLGAAARAGGLLQALDVTDCVDTTFDAVLAAVTANGGALRELRTSDSVGLRAYESVQVTALLTAAPRVCVVEADVVASYEDVRRLLRREPPFGPLRMKMLNAALDDDDVPGLAADLSTHDGLTALEMIGTRLDGPGALDAVVDAALACRLRSLLIEGCVFSAASAPALARLLSGNALLKLRISPNEAEPVDVPTAAMHGTALRANTSLTALTLNYFQLLHDDDAAAALLRSLVAHASLQTLDLSWNTTAEWPDDAHLLEHGAVAAALGALVAADAPALQTLDLYSCWLFDAALGPLVDALQHNTHLHTLDCRGNGMSTAFFRHQLLPAVRANTSLRVVRLDGVAKREMKALLATRAAVA